MAVEQKEQKEVKYIVPAEIAVYNRVKADLDKARSAMSDDAFMSYWEKRNDELRNLGIKTVGLGEE